MNNLSMRKGTVVATISCAVIFFLNFGVASLLSPCIPSIMGEFGVSATQVSLAPTINTISGIVFSMVNVKLIKKIGPKNDLFIAGAASIASGLVHFFAQNIYFFYVGSALNGMITAFGTVAVVSSTVERIQGKQFTKVMGIILGMGMLGSTGASLTVAAVIETLGWRYAFLFFQFGGAIICILLNLLFIRLRRPDENAGEIGEPVTIEPGVTRSVAVRSKSYYLMAAALVLNSTLYGAVSLFLSSYLQAYGVSATLAALTLTLLSLVGGILSMTSGYIVSRFGFKTQLILSYGCYAAGIVLLITWSRFTTPWLLIVALLLIAFIRMMTNGLASLGVSELFGRKDYMNITASLMPPHYVGGMIGMLGSGVLYDAVGSPLLTFVVVGVFSIIALVLMVVAQKISPYKRVAE